MAILRIITLEITRNTCEVSFVKDFRKWIYKLIPSCFRLVLSIS